MIVVSDTSPISNLLQVGEIDLLRQLFGRVIIPPTVYGEICRVDVNRVALEALDWVEQEELTNRDLRDRLINVLDAGEAEAIALAVQLNADYLLIDELEGRRVAKSLNIRITGILGILLSAKQAGFVSIIEPIIMRLVSDARFRLDPALIDTVLRRAGEK